MVIDGRNLPEGHVLETDLCIIGAGAAGITLALEFAGSSERVCLVESGGFEFDDDVQELYRGETPETGFQPYEPYDTRLRYFGGSTNHWGGYCRPYEAETFEVRPWIPYSGWPIDLRAVAPYYPKAAELCEIGPLGIEPPEAARRLGLPAFDLDGSMLRNVLFEVSPPTRFGEVYRESILGADNITVCLNSNVVAFETEGPAATVTRVGLATLTGRQFSIRARCFVLACGGIENARMLLISARSEGGLADPHGLVGRFFMEHPHFNLGSLALARRGWNPDFYLGEHRLEDGPEVNCHLGFPATVQEREGLANVYFQLRPRVPSAGEKSLHRIWGSLKLGHYPDDLGHHLQQVLHDLGEISGVFGNKLAHKLFGSQTVSSTLAVRAVGEQVPNPSSRITLAESTDALGQPRVSVDWEASEVDQASLRRAGELLATEIGRLGIGRMQLTYGPDDPSGPPFIEWGFHHIGTTRMADDPKQGVVDRDGRLHTAANLYVAGSSVFPTSGGGTPTLTIVALALRLANHLKTRVFV